MKITRDMKLDRLARRTCVRAMTRAGWREVRRLLVERFPGGDTSRVNLGEWFRIQQAVWSLESANAA